MLVPLKQGLKQPCDCFLSYFIKSLNVSSTKTRIETKYDVIECLEIFGLNVSSTKTRIETLQ